MPTDLNTLDDWWNEGFEDFFADASRMAGAREIEDDRARRKWLEGWYMAQAYRNAMKEQGQ